MPIPNFQNSPQTDADKGLFDFAHQDHHRSLIDFLQPTTDTLLAEFVLDPLPVDSATVIYQHQQMHDQLDELLGTPSYDMTSLNWRDPASRGEWVANNYNSHVNYAQVTGIE